MYFTIMMRASIYNKREWYVEEFADGNPLYRIHTLLKLVFGSREEVVELIHKKILEEGGSYTAVMPEQGKNKRKAKKGKRKKPYYGRDSLK